MGGRWRALALGFFGLLAANADPRSELLIALGLLCWSLLCARRALLRGSLHRLLRVTLRFGSEFSGVRGLDKIVKMLRVHLVDFGLVVCPMFRGLSFRRWRMGRVLGGLRRRGWFAISGTGLKK